MDNFKWLNNEKKYKIYDDGKIFSIKTNKFLIPSFNKKTNKLNISLVVNNKNTKFILHTLIYKTFYGEINKNSYIIHTDNNVYNNNFKNLKMVLRNENKNTIEFNKNEWKFIPNYENRYIINKEGEIKSLFLDKILEDNYNTKETNTYKTVKLMNNKGERKGFLVHRLVYSTFVGEINENMVIDHIDQNKLNNELENLRMVTKSENTKNCSRIFTKKLMDIKSNNFINISKKYKNIDFSNYVINEYGQIKNKHNKLLKIQKICRYEMCYLYDNENNKKYSIRINQLVASVFLENSNNYLIVHHKDENKLNNHYLNLEWTNHKNNITYTQGKKIGQYTLNNDFIKEFNCIEDAFKFLNKNHSSNITMVCNNRRKTAFGYKWKWI